MSEYEIHFHIQEEIMKWLPVKSLVQFRSISKAWKSLIDSSEFIVAHSLLSHTQPQHLLVSYEDPEEEAKYVCFVDDETLPQQRPVPTFPQSVKQLFNPRVVGISHGLVCLYGSDCIPITWNAVVWNPSIRKSIVVVVPWTPCVGFGVCPVTRDPKIVTIKQSWDISNIETSYHCEVMVYTLSSGEWRSLSSNLPTKPVTKVWSVVVTTDQFIYWHAELPARNMIMSFDLTSECFEVIDLPGSLACHDPLNLQNAKLRESLAILQSDISMISTVVWMMEGGVQRSFTKLFTIEASVHSIVGFRKSGVPIVQVEDDDEETKFVVYEPNSEHNNVLQISGDPIFFSVTTYMESLFMLGRSDCSSF